MANTLPHEIKRLIYDHADLETAKSLRLVSSSWAAVGVEILFLPTFVIKSYSIDIQRLVDIGSRENIALQAAKTIRTLEFKDNEYDPTMVRTVFCSRHVQVSNYEKVDFVPNHTEQASLDEIDAVIKQRKVDDEVMTGKTEDFLIEAFRNVPLVDTLNFSFFNPFQQHLLKKVWDEYDFKMYDCREPIPECLELGSLLSAVRNSGLKIKYFTHGRFSSARFYPDADLRPYQHLKGCKSLTLTVFHDSSPFTDPDFDENVDQFGTGLRDLLLASSDLEHLHLTFESLERPPCSFLPSERPGQLKTLALTSITVPSADFLSFLSNNASTLRYVSISQADIRDSDYTWREFLEQIRINPEFNLEKFQLSGLIRSPKETWLQWPIYNTGWMEYENLDWARIRGRVGSNETTKAIEDFVMQKGDWPIEITESNFDLPRIT